MPRCSKPSSNSTRSFGSGWWPFKWNILHRHDTTIKQYKEPWILRQNPQAHQTAVIRDYRPQHTLIEKVISPDVIYNLLLANLPVRYATRVVTLDRSLAHGLYSTAPKIDSLLNLRPRLSTTSPYCPPPVRDMLFHEDLQRWTCVQVSQTDIMTLRVGEYQ